mmetsp:Transcript_1891/g.2921  ORF Transcript_1891/g.2921 Transcript_1891/m.2921 type:complete len:310 (+) Transcript_1891:6-935(+)
MASSPPDGCARKASPPSPPMLWLPDELLGYIAQFLPARDLAALLRVQQRWRPIVSDVARRKLCCLDENLRSSRCWLLALASVEALVGVIGRRPEHGWVAELPALAQIREQEAGVTGRIETLLVKSAMAAELRHGLCWPLEDALGVALLCTFFRGAFAKVLRRTACYESGVAPASQWMLRDALLSAAERQQNPAPNVYALLQGAKSSLCENDPSWLALEGIEAGSPTTLSLLTHSPAIASATRREARAGSTWVCFESLPASRAGHRSLIDLGSGFFLLPALACVSVTRIEKEPTNDGPPNLIIYMRACFA